MKRFVAFLFPFAFATSIAVAGQQPDRTVWSGVYTTASADHGQKEYKQYCSSCHKDDLTGKDDAPALVGPSFFKRWQNLSVFDLFFAVQGQLYNFSSNPLVADFAYHTPEDIRDIVAYLFKANGLPPGQELSTDFDALRRIQITASASH